MCKAHSTHCPRDPHSRCTCEGMAMGPTVCVERAQRTRQKLGSDTTLSPLNREFAFLPWLCAIDIMYCSWVSGFLWYKLVSWTMTLPVSCNLQDVTPTPKQPLIKLPLHPAPVPCRSHSTGSNHKTAIFSYLLLMPGVR